MNNLNHIEEIYNNSDDLPILKDNKKNKKSHFIKSKHINKSKKRFCFNCKKDRIFKRLKNQKHSICQVCGEV